MSNGNAISTIGCIAAVNNQNILNANLLTSEDLQRFGIPFFAAEGFPSAGAAYNYGMQKIDREVLVYTHQDVYLPKGWFNKLKRTIHTLPMDWGVLGVIGMDLSGNVVGRTWCHSNQRELGAEVSTPIEVKTIDEVVIVINRKTELTFDANLPSFHLYGTDIILQAIKAGYKAYVFDGPVIHNTKPFCQYDRQFVKAYRYMKKKWKADLPIDNLCVTITSSRTTLLRKQIRYGVRNILKGRPSTPCLENPAEKASRLGYE